MRSELYHSFRIYLITSRFILFFVFCQFYISIKSCFPTAAADIFFHLIYFDTESLFTFFSESFIIYLYFF